jgi:hypothetical protein
VTPAELLAAVEALAKAGSAGLDFWLKLAGTATEQVKNNLVHDGFLKPAPDMGAPIQKGE